LAIETLSKSVFTKDELLAIKTLCEPVFTQDEVLAIVRYAKQRYLNEINRKENGGEGKSENGRNGMLETLSVHFGEGWRCGENVHMLGVSDIESCSDLETIKKLIPDLTHIRKYVEKKTLGKSNTIINSLPSHAGAKQGGGELCTTNVNVSPVGSPGRFFNGFLYFLFFFVFFFFLCWN
jgi:hypothetical protein